MDLWEFNERTLKNSTKELPNSILKEQADMLSEKTGGVIYGTITNMKFTPDEEKVNYNLATVFDVVVPGLDNYRFTLLNLYSRPENDYPIAITVGTSVVEDTLNFDPECECENRQQFIEELKKILSSEEINKKIEILYSKASF